MIQNQQIPLDLSWPAEKTIRADLVPNRELFRLLIKIVLFFFLVCYGSRLLPDAIEVTSYIPEKWEQVDEVEVHDVSPLSRFLKVYALPVNLDEDMDLTHTVEVWTLRDSEQKDNKLTVQTADLSNFVDISQDKLRYYFGDIHILDEVAYKVKIFKPIKLKARRLEQQTNSTTNELSSLTEDSNFTTNSTEDDEEERQKQNKRKQQEEKRKEQEQSKRKEEQKKKQQQEKAKKQKQEQQRKEEEERRRVEEEQRKQRQEEQRKQEEQRQKLYDYTNIKIEVHKMSSFATVLELITRFLSMLVLVYVVADNANAPKSIAIICAITSNPLMFLQLSYPNRVSNVIDSLCKSGPVLYFTLWVYYIHTHVRFAEHSKLKGILAVKIGFGILLYFLNMIRLLHSETYIFEIEMIVGAGLAFLVGSYLWEAFLNLQRQHHRDKVLVVVALVYLSCIFTFKILIGQYKQLMTYLVHQVYGLCIIYLMASPKVPRLSKLKRSQSQVVIKHPKEGDQQIKDEH